MTTTATAKEIIASIVNDARGYARAASVYADRAREAATLADATDNMAYASERAVAVSMAADRLHEAICTTANEATGAERREATNAIKECKREATEWAGVAAIAVYQRREHSN